MWVDQWEPPHVIRPLSGLQEHGKKAMLVKLFTFFRLANVAREIER